MPDIGAAIVGVGSAVPAKVMTNADFTKFLDTSDEWITQRTGIKERRLLEEGSGVSSLVIPAARNAIANAKISPDDIDLIVCGTVSSDMIFPSTACLVQRALGITKDIPAFDLSAACSGFLYALATGTQFIKTGMYKNVLVIGADALSKFCDFKDRGSCILFGDGAGAVVLQATAEKGKGVLYNKLCADGAGWDFIHVPGGGSKMPATNDTISQGQHFVKMKGRDVYKFAVEKMQWLLGDCMEKAGLTVNDVDYVVPHQVNIRIIESAVQKFHFPMDKVFVNIDRYGNTSAASIPLAMDEAFKAGKLGPGKTIIMVAFGAGLTWAGSVVKF